jgi:hypothetical protein
MKNPVDMESPENHPAASYWLQLGNRGNLKSLEVIQGESTRSVYRLSISATPQQQTSQTEPKPDTTNAIIAKRAPREDIAKEAKFYLSLLPHLPMVPLQTYGVIEDENPAYSWLFMADAGNQSYNPDNPKHRVLAAEWLANLHIESGRRRPCGELDDRGPEHFFPVLLKALQTLQNWRNSPEIGDNDRPVLEDILGFCLRLEANWSGIEHFCDTMPKTLVHGDIKEDNMRIGGTQRRPILLVFDWHEGG